MWDIDHKILEEKYLEISENHKIGQMDFDGRMEMLRNLKKTPAIFSYEVSQFFVEKKEEILKNFVTNFLSGKKLPWKKVSANDLIRVWKNFAKNNYQVHERDLNILDKIKHQILHNIVALHVGNELSGHSQINPKESLDMLGYEFDEKQMDKFIDYLELDGEWLVSDYGLPYLEKLFGVLYLAKTPEEELYTIDKILNVIHQRNDLSSFFIEGGVKTLMQVSENFKIKL